MTIVVGLMGPAGAGKSSVGNYLVEHYGAKRYSFAGPLKEMVGRALEFTDDQLYGNQASKEAPDARYGGKSARWFLQRIGTEGCRKTFGEGFWTEQLMAKIAREAPPLAVIEDARFQNEAEAIRKFGVGTVADNHFQMSPSGFVWRLDSPDRETDCDAGHASEQEYLKAPYDYLIAPPLRGLDLLYRLVDEACLTFKLFPTRRAVAL